MTLLTTAGWKYQTDQVYLAPYTEELAHNQDGLLGHLYLRTKQDGLLEVAFPGLPNLHMDKFVSYLTGPKVVLQIYYVKSGTAMTPVGYCYLYNVDGKERSRLAEFGFCFFREYWGQKAVTELGWLCIAYWFEALKVDILFGATRVDNRLASIFARKYGFEEEAVLRKFLNCGDHRCDARIMVCERDKFLKLWYERQAPNAA